MHRRWLCVALLVWPWLARAGGVFWTDRNADQLKRMNFDGTGLQTLTLSGTVIVPGTSRNLRGIAVDTSSNLVFWADNGADRLLRARLDGTGSAILYTITGGNSFPADVCHDSAGQFLYWCDQQRNRIQRSTYAGAAVMDVITNAAPTGPYFMDLDLRAGKIYWGDFDGGAIYRANLDGSGRETLLTGNNRTRGVKLDPTEAMLYWINRDDKKVHRCPLAALTNGPMPLTHPAVQTLYTNLDTPHGLALDIPARKLYWADTGTNPGSGQGERAVCRGDFDGRTPLEVLATGSEPWDVDLDLRCNHYAEWRQRCFRRDAPPALTGPSADPDEDGLPNAVEYAWDLSPLHPDRAGWPSGFLTAGPVPQASYPAVQYRRRADALDLTSFVQSSTNLVDWAGSPTEPTTVEIEVFPLGHGLERVTARTREPLAGQTSRFLRVVVALAPSPGH